MSNAIMLTSIMNWQSWSPLTDPLIKFPIRNFCPVKQVSPPNIKPSGFYLKPTISGCCTWYRFGKNITQEKVVDFATKTKRIHPEIKYVLIDDGWCNWGSWDQPKFSIKDTSQELSKMGLETGLWLAPFFKTTPPFNLRKIVDFSEADNLAYIHSCLKTIIEDWGITLLKLDFLYAPYFQPGLKDDLIPHNHLVNLFKFIKDNYPHVYLMTCGCPFEPAKYLVDSIRISDDITVPSLYSYGFIKKIVHNHQHNLLIKKWSSCQNLAVYFNLDPDVLPDQDLAGFSDLQMKQLEEIFTQSKVQFYG
jgi:hypothetical protein